MKYKAIFFDLDGTLTNPEEGIVNSIQYAADFYGISTKREDLLQYIGPPLKDTFSKLIGPEKAQEAVVKYRERFVDGGGLYENELYEGVPQVLKQLKEKGYVLCTASSKPQVFVDKILEYFDIKKYFDFVGGAGLDDTLSTKEAVIAHVLEGIGIQTHEVLMVGDRKYDLIGAQALGMDTIGVLYGFGSKQELSQYPHIALINSIDDLIEYLA